jgi:hypothetical protein
MGIEVPIEFVAQFDKALAQMKGFGGEVQKNVQGIHDKFEGLKTIFETIAGLYVIEKLATGMGHIVEEAIQAEAVTVKLGQALRASGDFSVQNVEAFKAMADQLAEVSRFDDDLILSQVSLAKSFNTTNREADKLIRAAVQLASATGEDLSTAVRALGQTLDGTAGRIGEMIPSLKLLTDEQLRNGAAIDYVAKRYAGFSESELDSFQGRLIQVTKSFTDLQKAIGEPIVNSKEIGEIFKAVRDEIIGLTKTIKNNRGEIVDFVANGLYLAVKAVELLVTAFSVLNETIYLDIALLGSAGQALFAFKTRNVQGLKEAFTTAKDAVKGFVGFLNDENGGQAAGSKILDRISKDAGTLADKIAVITNRQKQFVEAAKEGATTYDNQSGTSKRFDQTIIEKFKALKEAIKDFSSTQEQTLQNKLAREIDIIEQLFKLGSIKDAERIELETKLRLKANKEIYAAIQQDVQKAYQNPFASSNPNANGSLGLGGGTQSKIGAGLGVVGDVLGGASGASKMVGQITSAIGVALFGPVGELLGPLAETLSKGPDAVKQMVQDFAKALPDLIDGLIRAIPVLIEEIIDQIPNIIEALIDHVPDIVEALIRGIPRVIIALIALIPRVIAALVTGAARVVGEWVSGAAQFVGKILEGAVQFIQKIIEGITQGVGSKNGLFGSGVFNFSGGGFGIGGDKGLLGGGLVSGILQQVARGSARDPSASAGRLVNGPATITVVSKIGNNEFAKSIIDVKRLGYRLEPI